MRFIFYTDKTVPQSVQALSERLQGGGKLQGRVTKNSPHFTLSTATKVLNRFSRSTKLEGTLSREEGVTVIQGYVSEGMERGRWFLLFLGVLILTFVFYIVGNALLAILTILVGAWSYIPLTGDDHNSDSLLRELKRTLNAKDSKPKSESSSTSASTVRPTATARPSSTSSPFGARPSTPPATKPPVRPSNPPRK